LATKLAAILPPAPERASTSTGCPKPLASSAPTMRATTSPLPPAAKPWMKLIGRAGQVWASNASCQPRPARTINDTKRKHFHHGIHLAARTFTSRFCIMCPLQVSHCCELHANYRANCVPTKYERPT